MERVCSELLSRRARARAEAVVSGEGGSPNMKNLMKAPIRITTDNWPRRNPSVKDSLPEDQSGGVYGWELEARTKTAGAAESHLRVC